MSVEVRPLTVLVAALGGEGGGVLSDWLIAAATLESFPVQSTSIPGVAQRTGATTYYLEIFPHKAGTFASAPILALTPSPADIDLVAATELIEAGRAIQNGYVSPNRTTLIASTSRVYAIGERTAMADGRFDGDRVIEAAGELAQRALLFDMTMLAERTGAPINSVLFGAMIGSAVLPLSRVTAERAIRDSRKSVEANLRGFAAGFDAATVPLKVTAEAARAIAIKTEESLFAQVRSRFPASLHEVIDLGLQRLLDYQGLAYARLYLDRLDRVLRVDQAGVSPGASLTREVARFLALWMSYEDVIRVADLKTRADRTQRVRKEVRAKDGEVVRIVDFLKPGIDELSSLLPPALGRRVLESAEKRGVRDRFNVGLHIHSTGVFGFLTLRMLAKLRWWRPRSWRYQQEQALIERWLDAILTAAMRDTTLALEVAECAQLVKGYGDTHKRGTGNFNAISAAYFGAPLLQADAPALAKAIGAARRAALADPDGDALRNTLSASADSIAASAIVLGSQTKH